MLLSRLEDEGNNNQKLMSEKAAAESKIKGLEEQLTLSEDNVSKVTDSVYVYCMLLSCASNFGHSMCHADSGTVNLMHAMLFYCLSETLTCSCKTGCLLSSSLSLTAFSRQEDSGGEAPGDTGTPRG